MLLSLGLNTVGINISDGAGTEGMRTPTVGPSLCMVHVDRQAWMTRACPKGFGHVWTTGVIGTLATLQCVFSVLLGHVLLV